MARFQFNVRCLVSKAMHHPVVAQRTLRALHLEEACGAQGAEPQGPGWFDSSWELVRGLDVREGLPGDARLHEWLATCLASAAPRGAPAHASHVGDRDFAAASEAMLLDELSEFGIDGLQLV